MEAGNGVSGLACLQIQGMENFQRIKSFLLSYTLKATHDHSSEGSDRAPASHGGGAPSKVSRNEQNPT